MKPPSDSTQTMAAADLFTEPQKRRLQSTLHHIDELLSEIVDLLSPSRSLSPFSEHLSNATPVQRKVVSDYAARARDRMREICERARIPLPEKRIATTWAARTTLTFALVSLDDIRPQHLRGYGELSEAARSELDLIVSELSELFGRIETQLAQGRDRDLRCRLERFGTDAGAPRVLEELERVITTHGLTEFRGALGVLVEKLELAQFEVAVFGRVSSGKSSLLDYVLETDALPVGVTPVTAIPTRITFGEVPRATVWFAEKNATTLPPERLAEFIAEQENPGNAKHVTRVLLEIPSSRLLKGISFVDTPGLGSLALAGSAESLAYLPRCDLGIVLVDCSSTVTPEDIALLHSLHQAGAETVLLLSKADVLSEGERATALEYTRRHLKENLAAETPIYPVSVRSGSSQLCDFWVNEDLLPRLTASQKLNSLSLNQKTESLRALVAQALHRKLRGSGTFVEDNNGHQRRQFDREFMRTIVRLDAAMETSPVVLQRTSEVVNRAIGVASREVAHDDGADPRGILIEELLREGEAMARSVAADLLTARAHVYDLLERAGRATPSLLEQASDLPKLTGMPALSAGTDLPAFSIRRKWLRACGRVLAQRIFQNQLKEELEPALDDVLSAYAKRLDDWRKGFLIELKKKVSTAADLQRASELGGESGEPDTNASSEVQRDLDVLGKLRPQ